jgi:CheY-like chemotaxis protein
VLVVDDYPDCREMYATYLAMVGFKVLKARDGAEALQLARDFVPDVILMDLSLPDIDGWEATRRLKQDAATRDIPVIALTAQYLPMTGAPGGDAFHSIVTKPCPPDDIAARVAGLVLSRREKVLRDPGPPSATL